MNTNQNQKSRHEILDGLRGVAALIVLLYHHFEMYSGGDPVAAWFNLDKPVRKWLRKKA